MKAVMKIEDSFLIAKTGLIVSGVNSKIDALSKDEVKAEIGTQVKIVLPSGEEIETQVREVLISDSLVGKKNISIALGEMTGVTQIDKGSVLYSIE
ncbi:MAG: hypothetical protein VSS75_004845 [Candidatus Parabeggiatoa sp.]|nr:hypothetical protein [Candidatus Parabeggiatoa sp.]